VSMGYVSFLTNTRSRRHGRTWPTRPSRHASAAVFNGNPSRISNQRWPCGNKPPTQFSSDCSVGGRLSISVYSPLSDYSL
jgi:hypothetical protein